ncbi:MAG TPA: hypothetical protein ENK53_05615 [Thiotrichales bacterium]|nr:hypothetical protein [Thiotrichales bacterium]
MTTLPLKNTANSLGSLLFGLFTHIVQGVLTLAAGGFAWWFAASALPAGYAGLAPIMGLVMALITARYFYGSGSVATAAGAVLASGLQDEGDESPSYSSSDRLENRMYGDPKSNIHNVSVGFDID